MDKPKKYGRNKEIETEITLFIFTTLPLLCLFTFSSKISVYFHSLLRKEGREKVKGRDERSGD
jgi:hypothetical protein